MAVLLALPARAGARAGAAGPVETSRPAIDGTLQQGRRLRASPGTWIGAGAIDYRYQWYRCSALGTRCSSIHGATTGSYTEVAADVRRALAVTVTASDANGSTAAYSTLAGVVAPVSATVVASGAAPLSGEPIVGRALTVAPPTWSGPAAGTPGFAWLRCNLNGRLCAQIPAQSATTYTITAADVGHVLVATVTQARRTVLSVGSAPARATPGPVALAPPTISGTQQQGAKLTGSAGSWAGSGTVAFEYQWSRCSATGARCSSIRGATRDTYTEVAADVGQALALTVHATDSTGTTVAYSSLIGVIAARSSTLAATAQPALTGTPTVGGTLSVAGGSLTLAAGTSSFTWLRCNARARLCVPIPGAADPGYTVTAADAGHALVAQITSDAGGFELVVLSTAAFVPA